MTLSLVHKMAAGLYVNIHSSCTKGIIKRKRMVIKKCESYYKKAAIVRAEPKGGFPLPQNRSGRIKKSTLIRRVWFSLSSISKSNFVNKHLCLPFLFWHVISLLRFNLLNTGRSKKIRKKGWNILTFLRIDLDRPGSLSLSFYTRVDQKSVKFRPDPMKWKPTFSSENSKSPKSKWPLPSTHLTFRLRHPLSLSSLKHLWFRFRT